MSHPNPHHDRENERVEDSKFAPRKKSPVAYSWKGREVSKKEFEFNKRAREIAAKNVPGGFAARELSEEKKRMAKKMSFKTDPKPKRHSSLFEQERKRAGY